MHRRHRGANYRIGADIRAVDADQCFLGWDEYVQPGCVQTNGLFIPAAPAPVTTARFTTLDAVLRTSPGVQSVEMVIVCQTNSNGAAEFVVDDVYLLPGPLFADGFEDD